MDLTSLERARALDGADPLGPFRARFAVPDPGLVYLDGNSLGRPPLAAIEAVRHVAEAEWPGELIRGWEHWLDAPLRVGDLLGTGILGARAGEVAVTDSTTVNLFRVASAALDARPGRRAIAIAAEEFPTDRYIVEGLAAARGLEIRWLADDPIDGLTLREVERVLDDDLALLVLSHVNYRSAAIADMPAMTAPGAPAYLYVREELQDDLRPPIQGWFAQAEQFEMGPRFERRAGIGGWLVGTPGILALAAAEAGIALSAEAGIERIRAKGVALTEYALELLDAWLAPLGCGLGSPRDSARRGNHVSIRHPDARRLTARLIEGGVIPDFRAPDSIRLGPSPLTTSFEDVRRGLEALRALLADDVQPGHSGPEPS